MTSYFWTIHFRNIHFLFFLDDLHYDYLLQENSHQEHSLWDFFCIIWTISFMTIYIRTIHFRNIHIRTIHFRNIHYGTFFLFFLDDLHYGYLLLENSLREH